MDNQEKRYKLISLFLLAAIAAVIIFVILPKYQAPPAEDLAGEIDFSSSSWIESAIADQVGFFEKDFFIGTAFSYNPRSNKMVATYATQKSVEEVRQFYLALPGARESGRNDETSLDITIEKQGGETRIFNYYSPISRVIEIEHTLDAASAQEIISQLAENFPGDQLDRISHIQGLTAGEIFGGYVRYRYDELDEYAYPYTPIFSRAYLFQGSAEDFATSLQELNAAYPNYKYDNTQNAYYYKINGHILSATYFVTDSAERVVSLSIQAAREPAP